MVHAQDQGPCTLYLSYRWQAVMSLNLLVSTKIVSKQGSSKTLLELSIQLAINLWGVVGGGVSNTV
jgi:hypothetical protein